MASYNPAVAILAPFIAIGRATIGTNDRGAVSFDLPQLLDHEVVVIGV